MNAAATTSAASRFSIERFPVGIAVSMIDRNSSGGSSAIRASTMITATKPMSIQR